MHQMSLCTAQCALICSATVTDLQSTPFTFLILPTLMQVATARLVSGVFGRVAGAAAAQEELAVLRGRVQHLCGMNTTIPSIAELQLHGADAHDGSQRQLVHAGLAVRCAALGLAGAYLMIRRSR